MAQAGQPGGCSQGKNFSSWSSRHGSEKVANSGNILRVRQAGLADKLLVVKRLPTTEETWFQSLGGEDPLEKEMATHSSILAWKIPWMEEPGRLQSMGLQRVGHD